MAHHADSAFSAHDIGGDAAKLPQAQTENFFIGHLSSKTEADYLSSVQSAFKGREDTIMRNRTPGWMQMLTYSHRYVVPIQAYRYEGRQQFVLPSQV